LDVSLEAAIICWKA